MALPTTFTQELKDRIVAQRKAMQERFFTSFANAKVTMDPEGITKEIIAQLNKERREIVVKMLGFNDSWGKLEVDNCNGRNEKSIVGVYLRTHAEAAVNEWMKAHMKGALEEHVRGKFSDAKLLAAAKKHFDEQFEWQLRKAIESAAAKAAQDVANEFTAAVREGVSLSPEDTD